MASRPANRQTPQEPLTTCPTHTQTHPAFSVHYVADLYLRVDVNRTILVRDTSLPRMCTTTPQLSPTVHRYHGPRRTSHARPPSSTQRPAPSSSRSRDSTALVRISLSSRPYPRVVPASRAPTKTARTAVTVKMRTIRHLPRTVRRSPSLVDLLLARNYFAVIRTRSWHTHTRHALSS